MSFQDSSSNAPSDVSQLFVRRDDGASLREHRILALIHSFSTSYPAIASKLAVAFEFVQCLAFALNPRVTGSRLVWGIIYLFQLPIWDGIFTRGVVSYTQFIVVYWVLAAWIAVVAALLLVGLFATDFAEKAMKTSGLHHVISLLLSILLIPSTNIALSAFICQRAASDKSYSTAADGYVLFFPKQSCSATLTRVQEGFSVAFLAIWGMMSYVLTLTIIPVDREDPSVRRRCNTFVDQFVFMYKVGLSVSGSLLLAYGHAKIQSILVAIYSFVLACLFCLYLPYYSAPMNAFSAVSYALIGWSALTIVIADYTTLNSLSMRTTMTQQGVLYAVLCCGAVPVGLLFYWLAQLRYDRVTQRLLAYTLRENFVPAADNPFTLAALQNNLNLLPFPQNLPETDAVFSSLHHVSVSILEEGLQEEASMRRSQDMDPASVTMTARTVSANLQSVSTSSHGIGSARALPGVNAHRASPPGRRASAGGAGTSSQADALDGAVSSCRGRRSSPPLPPQTPLLAQTAESLLYEATRRQVVSPTIRYALFSSDAEVAVRFLNEWQLRTETFPTPHMVSFACRIFHRFMLKYPRDGLVVIAYISFICDYGPSLPRLMLCLNLIHRCTAELPLSLTERYLFYYFELHVRESLGMRDTIQQSFARRVRGLHQEVLMQTALVWRSLLEAQRSPLALYVFTSRLAHTRAHCFDVYTGMMRDVADDEMLVRGIGLYMDNVYHFPSVGKLCTTAANLISRLRQMRMEKAFQLLAANAVDQAAAEGEAYEDEKRGFAGNMRSDLPDTFSSSRALQESGEDSQLSAADGDGGHRPSGMFDQANDAESNAGDSDGHTSHATSSMRSGVTHMSSACTSDGRSSQSKIRSSKKMALQLIERIENGISFAYSELEAHLHWRVLSWMNFGSFLLVVMAIVATCCVVFTQLERWQQLRYTIEDMSRSNGFCSTLLAQTLHTVPLLPDDQAVGLTVAEAAILQSNVTYLRSLIDLTEAAHNEIFYGRSRIRQAAFLSSLTSLSKFLRVYTSGSVFYESRVSFLTHVPMIISTARRVADMMASQSTQDEVSSSADLTMLAANILFTLAPAYTEAQQDIEDARSSLARTCIIVFAVAAVACAAIIMFAAFVLLWNARRAASVVAGELMLFYLLPRDSVERLLAEMQEQLAYFADTVGPALDGKTGVIAQAALYEGGTADKEASQTPPQTRAEASPGPGEGGAAPLGHTRARPPSGGRLQGSASVQMDGVSSSGGRDRFTLAAMAKSFGYPLDPLILGGGSEGHAVAVSPSAASFSRASMRLDAGGSSADAVPRLSSTPLTAATVAAASAAATQLPSLRLLPRILNRSRVEDNTSTPPGSSQDSSFDSTTLTQAKTDEEGAGERPAKPLPAFTAFRGLRDEQEASNSPTARTVSNLPDSGHCRSPSRRRASRSMGLLGLTQNDAADATLECAERYDEGNGAGGVGGGGAAAGALSDGGERLKLLNTFDYDAVVNGMRPRAGKGRARLRASGRSGDGLAARSGRRASRSSAATSPASSTAPRDATRSPVRGDSAGGEPNALYTSTDTEEEGSEGISEDADGDGHTGGGLAPSQHAARQRAKELRRKVNRTGFMAANYELAKRFLDGDDRTLSTTSTHRSGAAAAAAAAGRSDADGLWRTAAIIAATGCLSIIGFVLTVVALFALWDVHSSADAAQDNVDCLRDLLNSSSQMVTFTGRFVSAEKYTDYSQATEGYLKLKTVSRECRMQLNSTAYFSVQDTLSVTQLIGIALITTNILSKSSDPEATRVAYALVADLTWESLPRSSTLTSELEKFLTPQELQTWAPYSNSTHDLALSFDERKSLAISVIYGAFGLGMRESVIDAHAQLANDVLSLSRATIKRNFSRFRTLVIVAVIMWGLACLFAVLLHYDTALAGRSGVSYEEADTVALDAGGSGAVGGAANRHANGGRRSYILHGLSIAYLLLCAVVVAMGVSSLVRGTSYTQRVETYLYDVEDLVRVQWSWLRLVGYCTSYSFVDYDTSVLKVLNLTSTASMQQTDEPFFPQPSRLYTGVDTETFAAMAAAKATFMHYAWLIVVCAIWGRGRTSVYSDSPIVQYVRWDVTAAAASFDTVSANYQSLYPQDTYLTTFDQDVTAHVADPSATLAIAQGFTNSHMISSLSAAAQQAQNAVAAALFTAYGSAVDAAQTRVNAVYYVYFGIGIGALTVLVLLSVGVATQAIRSFSQSVEERIIFRSGFYDPLRRLLLCLTVIFALVLLVNMLGIYFSSQNSTAASAVLSSLAASQAASEFIGVASSIVSWSAYPDFLVKRALLQDYLAAYLATCRKAYFSTREAVNLRSGSDVTLFGGQVPFAVYNETTSAMLRASSCVNPAGASDDGNQQPFLIQFAVYSDVLRSLSQLPVTSTLQQPALQRFLADAHSRLGSMQYSIYTDTHNALWKAKHNQTTQYTVCSVLLILAFLLAVLTYVRCVRRFTNDVQQQSVGTKLMLLGLPPYVLNTVPEITDYYDPETGSAGDQAKKRMQQSERLLQNIMPPSISRRLKNGERVIADAHSCVTVVFAALVGMEAYSHKLQGTRKVSFMNGLVVAFDHIVDLLDLEKIKLVGDIYFFCGGLTRRTERDHAIRCMEAALFFFQALEDHNGRDGTPNIKLKIGINTGPVVAGVIGNKKVAYDLWGDCVNTASRMYSTGEAGRVQVSESTYARVGRYYQFEDRHVQAKGKGTLLTHLYVDRLRPTAYADLKWRVSN